MAAHARLENKFTEDEKYHNLMSHFVYASSVVGNSIGALHVIITIVIYVTNSRICIGFSLCRLSYLRLLKLVKKFLATDVANLMSSRFKTDRNL